MGYRRVIPRDLFNEASLLKCYGRLYIELEKVPGNKACYSQEDVASFNIVQRENDGSIEIRNLALVVGKDWFRLTRPMNSRRPWPLYAEKIGDADFDPVEVFDEAGNLTSAMIALVTKE